MSKVDAPPASAKITQEGELGSGLDAVTSASHGGGKGDSGQQTDPAYTSERIDAEARRKKRKEEEVIAGQLTQPSSSLRHAHMRLTTASAARTVRIEL